MHKKQNMKIFKYIVVLAMAFIGVLTMPSCNSGSSDAKNGVELKLNFKTGDKYLYTTEIVQNIGIAAGMSMMQKMQMELLYSCTGDSAGTKKMDITYDHILMSMSSPMGEMTYDSKSPKADAAGMNILDSMIGKTFTLSVAPDGQIVAVGGLDKILESFTNNKDPQTQANIKNQLSDTAIRMMMQNSFDMYSGKMVKEGDTWNKKEQMTFSGIDVNVDNTFTLESVADGKANIKLNSAMNLPKTNMGAATQNAEMELNGKQEGTIIMDVATGQIISSKISTDIKGKMTMENVPQDINIRGTINVTSKKM